MVKHFNLADMFEMVADKIPSRDALVCGEQRATFAQLEQRANQLAHHLAAHGVKAGDHVGLYLYNCNEYLEGMLACFKIRAVPINVNYRYVEEELLYIFENADMVACIHNEEFIPHIAQVKDSAPGLKTFVCVKDDSGHDPASIGAIEYEAALAPLMHGACWWYACIQMLAGNSVVLNPGRSLVGEDVWDIVAREKVNTISIVGDAMAVPLLDALEANPGRWDLSSIFNIGSGGAVFSDSKQEAFRQHFPNIMITNSFGSSESGNMGFDGGGKKGQGLGNVAKDEFMSVISDVEGEPHRHVERGEMGIFARSGHIPVGYYNDPVKTAKTIVEVDGKPWLLLGEEARREEDDTITVYGRGSNCINSGGEKIFPEEVEQALKAHPGIFDCLVVATPDERFGSKVTAVVARRGDAALSLENVQEEARKHIAGYKVPRELHVVDEVPRAPSGKPAYPKALEIALSGEYLVV
jgi:acyl-CoA synthetase (AMP-forming)/AMP-acid ligase II